MADKAKNKRMLVEWKEKMRDITDFVNEKRIQKDDILSICESKDGGFILTYFVDED